MDGPIASAVVFPEEDAVPAPPSPTTLKRRQSSVSEQDAKRARIEEGTGNQDLSSSTVEKRPAPTVRRERGRERRLFGAVLGALSQAPATAGQKRRSEIEKRQQAKRELEDEESQQRRAERTARRKAQRVKEHQRFEREALQARHDNLLHMAHFLRTKTEPQLLYKPWETSPEEEEVIQDQIAEAKEIIERELTEYKGQQGVRETENKNLNNQRPSDNTAPTESTRVPLNGLATSSKLSHEGTNGSVTSSQEQEKQTPHEDNQPDKIMAEDAPSAVTQDQVMVDQVPPAEEVIKDDDDDPGEEVVEEAAEDTVIY